MHDNEAFKRPLNSQLLRYENLPLRKACFEILAGINKFAIF